MLIEREMSEFSWSCAQVTDEAGAGVVVKPEQTSPMVAARLAQHALVQAGQIPGTSWHPGLFPLD